MAMTMTREIDPISPDEMLLEEFLKPKGLSADSGQYRHLIRLKNSHPFRSAAATWHAATILRLR
jgi:hypothetical protein